MNHRTFFRIFKPACYAAALILFSCCGKDPVVTDPTSFTDSRDSHSYHWVAIGTQTWMAENLAYLPSVSPSSEGSDTEGYCYVYGNESTVVKTAKNGLNYNSYGALYNWKMAQTICPDGWHLPTGAEWLTLSAFLGGDLIAGPKLRSKSGWNGSGNGDNSSGFNAIPGGYRNKDTGFFLLGENAGFWSSTESDSTGAAVVRDLGYNYPDFGMSNYSKRGGFSIRCLKN